MKHKKKNGKWMKFRHSVVRNILFPTLGMFTRVKYRVKIKKFKEQQKRPYLVLYNHQTTFDQFFVGMAFKGPLYYLASEDLFSNGFVSSIIRYLVAPIPIKKSTSDVRAILNCIKVSREGGTIAIAPEGNRTYSGKTEYMSPAIAPLARKLGVPIALFRIEGGYGVQPRWSDVVRKGKMKAYVSEVIYPEEYASMSDDELFAAIKQGLEVNEAVADASFKHRKLAEYLERAVYVCPFCGFSEHESRDDRLRCKTCGREVRYLPTKEIEGVGFDFPFRFMAEWYDYQADFVNSTDMLLHKDAPIFEDCVDVYKVIPSKKKYLIEKSVPVSLYGDRVVIKFGAEELNCAFDDITAAAVLGRNKLNLYHSTAIYQFKSSKRFNALKYVHTYHRYKNIVEEKQDAKFLGL